MKLTSTKGAGVDRLHCLIHGPSGAGKTTLIGTTGDDSAVLILSAEAGLLPLRDREIDVLEITSLDQLAKVVRKLKAGGHKYRWICLDSLSEMAERILADEKKRQKDPRRAYGEMTDGIVEVVKTMRDMPCHVVTLCKQERVATDEGLLYVPSFPGKQLTRLLPYEYDLVLALRAERDEEGRVVRWLQTEQDGRYEAKDRSGVLDTLEPPNLQQLAAKIAGKGE